MEQEIQVAYLCSLDVVGYSKRISSGQVSIVEKLQSIFQKTISSMTVQQADYLSIFTGDGLVICFLSKPESALIFALKFTKYLNAENDKMLPAYRFQVRIGLHFGPVLPVTDITGTRNVLGSGINMCARVMNLGLPGQILASDVVYRLLSEHDQFSPLFQSLGSFSVKHGVVINIYNVFGSWKGNQVGNSSSPTHETSVAMDAILESKKYAFVIMAMSNEDPMLTDVHNCIKTICSRLDIRAERVDDIEYSGKITDRIVDSIQRADIIIADLTHGRPNVYYEIGLAHGQKNDVILLARADTKLHFDLSGFNVIFYRNITELTDRLEKRIRATVE